MKKVFAMLMCLMLVMVYMPSFAFADVATPNDGNESTISDDNEEAAPGDDKEESTPGDDKEESNPGDDNEEANPGEGDNNGGSTSGGGGTYIPTTPTKPAEPTHEEKVEAAKLELKAVTLDNFKARSKMVTLKNGKIAVKITWKNTSGVEFDGVEIFRSVKRYSGFTKKPFFSTKKDSYYNTAIESGNKYYYKVSGYVMVDDEKVYTDWSSKAWRTIK